jgi:hypothetical protein
MSVPGTTSSDGLTVTGPTTSDLLIGSSIVIRIGNTVYTRRIISKTGSDFVINEALPVSSNIATVNYSPELFYVQDSMRYRRVMVDAVGRLKLSNNIVVGYDSNTNPTARLDIDGASTIYDFASLRVRSGDAVTSPNNGDIWSITNDILKFRQNGATKDFALYETSGSHRAKIVGLGSTGGTLSLVAQNSLGAVGLEVYDNQNVHVVKNLSLFGATPVGNGVMSIKEAVTPPSTNPNEGEIFMWVDSTGAVIIRNAAGVDTAISPGIV